MKVPTFDDLRRTLGRGGFDSPPAPHEASPDDVERYVAKHMEANPRAYPAGGRRQSSDPTLQLPTAKEIDRNEAKYRAEFPWLYDPEKGVRWDFDPIELRILAQENAWVQMLIQSIVKELGETSWTITKGDQTETQKRLATHPDKRSPVSKELPDAIAEDIHERLRNPSPDADWTDFVEMVMADLLEVGSMTVTKAFPEDAYDGDDALAVNPAATTPLAIQVSAPEVWTKGYHDKTGIVSGYWQFDQHSTPGATESRPRGVGTPIHFSTDEVMWSDHSPRSNRRYGIPPTLIVRDFLESIDLAVTQEQQYLSRGSIPSGAWVFEEWDREQVKEWKEQNAENMKGKPHKSLMFAGQGGGVSFEPMSMNFSELEFTDRMKWYARVVAAAFQVPTAVVGVEPEQVNYNTFKGERQNFESNTLGPYLQQLERYINGQYARPHFGGEYRFEFTPGMSETTRRMISDRVRNEFNAGLKTRNEARKELGTDPVDDDVDGFKDEVVTNPDDGQLGEAEGMDPSADRGDEAATVSESAGTDATNATDATAKAEYDAGSGEGDSETDADHEVETDTDALRNTDEWHLFDVQPADIDALADEIREPVAEVFREVLNDEGVRREIETFSTAEGNGASDTEKSLTGLTRRLKEIIADSSLVADIRASVDDMAATEIRETLRDVTDAESDGVDTDPIIEALQDRETDFAAEFANRMSDDIRETVADGWREGKNSLEIRDDLQAKASEFGDWQAERIARQELQIASGEARNRYAAEAGKLEVWRTAGDDRVRDPHADMEGQWKRPSERWEVDYTDVDRGVQLEKVPGDSRPGIGCRCVTTLVDAEDVSDENHAGVAK